MYKDKKSVGNLGEDIAQKFLENNGYQIITRNWHAGKYGEIDLIATHSSGEVVFVEVKTRSGLGFGYPEAAVNKSKQIKLRNAAMSFALKYPQLPKNIRFDVIAIVLGVDGQVADLKHYKNVELM